MLHNILITGASGYLGGTLLARWQSAGLPPYGTLYALVRTEEQAQGVKQYGALPLVLDLQDHDKLTKSIIERGITVIFFLIDAFSEQHQKPMINALGEVKAKTGKEVHFLHTSGAKIFSSHTGFNTSQALLDTDPNIYDIQKKANPPYKLLIQPARTNTTVIDTAEDNGVRSYIFVPSIVYGEGEGFGNRISIQDVAIVKAAHGVRRVYKVDTNDPAWPVCHILDTVSLYLQILRHILQGNDIGHGRNGYFLAASGSIPWMDIYLAFAKALEKRGVVDDSKVEQANDAALANMGKALGVPPEYVPVQIGGKSAFKAAHGNQIGWKAEYPPENILEVADAEVEFILKALNAQ